MRLSSLFRSAPIALMALSACHGADTVSVDKAWVRLAAVPGRPAAAYVVLHGGTQPVRLVAIDSTQAGSSELHQSVKGAAAAMNGDMAGSPMMSMQRIDGLDVPAGGAIDFADAGYHVMLFGIGPQVKPGSRMPLSVRFAKGDPIAVQAKVIAAGDAAPF